MAGLREPLIAQRYNDEEELTIDAHDSPVRADSPTGSAAAPPAATAAAATEPELSIGPLGSRNPLSALAFSWVSPLLRRGSIQEQLHQRDLFALPPRLQPAACGRRLWARWTQVRVLRLGWHIDDRLARTSARFRAQRVPHSGSIRHQAHPSARTVRAQEQERAAARGTDPSLLRAIVAAFGWPYFRLGLLKLAGDSLNFAGPLLLNLLLRHLAAPPGGSGGGGGYPADLLHLLAWQVDVAAPGFGYACAALLAGSLVLKVRALAGLC